VQRSNRDILRGDSLDRFVALAMTNLLTRRRLHDVVSDVRRISSSARLV